MNVGKLYQVKKYYWFLYPSKEIVRAADVDAVGDDVHAALYAPYESKRFKCNVSYIEPNSIFVLLDQDEKYYSKYYKVLTTNGEIGWIVYREDEAWTNSFEEVKTE